MKKISFISVIATVLCFTACTSSPESYFERAILSCNTMQGFADDGLERELQSPTVQMINGDKDQFAPMKRKEIIDDRIQTLTSNRDKLRQLKETKDTKEVLQAANALYDYVLPVYTNEYKELARLYDEGATKESITFLSQSIHSRYYERFAELYNNLVAAGKPYAQKHNINVKWDIQTSPQ